MNGISFSSLYVDYVLASTGLESTGSANCPYFARAELLADNLETNLPDFKVHKIVKNQMNGRTGFQTFARKAWAHSSSPLIWRELLNRGGKGVLIGGSNEFQEYAAGYYGSSSAMKSSDMTTVSSENMETHLSVTEEEEHKKV
ncbi:putative malate dehydrogenase 1B-like [Apostichopus japonicus]|uniref:Putative malate dehydrogenase 1B-like n=1 Tax=Stichopus japonicus TaxID=307972 RepID=A0A2G8LIY8_STIJA|nr:putative malate dehydrogenase 1B-like [Apostichopus japonicus]